ncbi:MAG: tRNA preQ1(34) S-adenosylmethionine ribosyltransferase-isomerase QueA [Phycisphaeraceae bacterium]
MLTSALDYDLPPNLIATEPTEPRDAARLMVIHRATGCIEHRHVRDLPQLVTPAAGDLLVFNQSKVIPALFHGVRKATGGKVQGLYLNSPDANDATRWQVMLEARGSLQPGEIIALDPHAELELLTPSGGGEWAARLHSHRATLDLLHQIGSPPLPPYIRKARRALHRPDMQPADRERYNTVYAAQPGSVAAPTAGLHFTPQLLAALQAKGVELAYLTLHVGMGTFAPVRTENLADHPIHSEWISIPPQVIAAMTRTRQRGGRIIPIGTTTVRALESLPDPLPQTYETNTQLFITPDANFTFRFTDTLMTNFHLPRSTLLALVAALPHVGLPQLKAWYQRAIEQGYRFYSYGDAMLLL